jgi:hypothetical protein
VHGDKSFVFAHFFLQEVTEGTEKLCQDYDYDYDAYGILPLPGALGQHPTRDIQSRPCPGKSPQIATRSIRHGTGIGKKNNRRAGARRLL